MLSKLEIQLKHVIIPKCKTVIWKYNIILYVKILLLYLMLNSAQFMIIIVLAINVCMFYAKIKTMLCYVIFVLFHYFDDSDSSGLA